MPSQPKNVKNKGFFVCPGHMPCKEAMPRMAITEWLELDAPGNLISTIENVDGKLKMRTAKLNASSAPNSEWLAKEVARRKASNRNPEMEFYIHFSKDEKFACLCKRQKKQK